jgi:ParB family chromosome partitioning protein
MTFERKIFNCHTRKSNFSAPCPTPHHAYILDSTMNYSVFPRFLEEVSIKKIHKSMRQLRNSLDGLEELALSIEQKGLLQPIVVRPVKGGFEVVAGHRRLEACKLLGWSKIACHVAELDDREAYEVSMVENIQHRTMDPIEEALAFKKYVETYGYGSVSDLAKRIGKSQEYVSKRIRLLDLPSEVKEEVMSRRMTPSVAQELVTLKPDEAIRLSEIITRDKLTRREVRLFKRKASNLFRSTENLQPNYFDNMVERRRQHIHRALGQSVAALRVCLMRVDDIIDYVDNEWVVKESLFELRKSLHNHIDDLLVLRKKLEFTLPPQ